jgi:Ser/Thr protein kinase RdoA (MazF antagonist)
VNKELLESLYMSAATRALKRFPVDAQDVKLIAHSENVTFRVSVIGSNTDYVLRLHRPGYNTIEELNSERIWTRSLKEAGMLVPGSLPTRHGELFTLVDIPAAGKQCYAGMTTWLEGSPLNEFLETRSDNLERARIFSRIGEIAATIHNQSTTWTAPAGFTRRRLDLDGLLGEAPHWGRFWEHADLTETEQKLLLRTREKIRNALLAYGERPDNFSLIHADLHPENIVYHEGSLALIDFDDSAHGWHLYEIASALIEYAYTPDLGAYRDALLAGYRQQRPLATQDLEMLPAFLLMRGMAIIGWFHQRPEHSGSEYFKEMKNWVIGECAQFLE